MTLTPDKIKITVGQETWPAQEPAPLRRLADWADRHIAVLFNIPTVAILTLMILIHAAMVLWTSLTDAHLYRPEEARFVGISNYLQALSEPR